MNVNQRNSSAMKNEKTCIWHLFYPSNLRELILWYWFSNPLLPILIDQICTFCCIFTLDIFSNCLFQKKSKYGGQGLKTWNFHSRERTLKNPRAQLKKKWNFWGFKEKLMWNFLGSWFLTLEFPRGGTQLFCRISDFQGQKVVFFRISEGKVTNLKIPGGFQKSISTTPTCLHFFWNSPMNRWVSSKKSNYYFSSMATGSIPEKNPNRGRVNDLKFLGGIFKKYNAEIPEVN